MPSARDLIPSEASSLQMTICVIEELINKIQRVDIQVINTQDLRGHNAIVNVGINMLIFFLMITLKSAAMSCFKSHVFGFP